MFIVVTELSAAATFLALADSVLLLFCKYIVLANSGHIYCDWIG